MKSSIELFSNIEESLSPRLYWILRHKIIRRTYVDDKGKQIHVAEAYGIRVDSETEDDALCKLACATGIKLWNEEEI